MRTRANIAADLIKYIVSRRKITPLLDSRGEHTSRANEHLTAPCPFFIHEFIHSASLTRRTGDPQGSHLVTLAQPRVSSGNKHSC